jgi:cell division protein FtsI (penicillin-binding protein 3)
MAMPNIKLEVMSRLYIVVGMLFMFGCIVLFRVADVAVLNSGHWKSKQENRQLSMQPLSAERGNILAADGTILASSQMYYDIRFDSTLPSQELWDNNIDSLSAAIADMFTNVLNEPYTFEAVKQWLVSHRIAQRRYMTIFEHVSAEKADIIRAFPIFREGQLRGGYIEQKFPKRHLPFSQMARRTIGTYRDEEGSWTGLESSYNQFLRGRNDSVQMIKTYGNVWIPLEDLADFEPVRGHDVVTHLDVGIQDITHNALATALRNHQAAWGCAVVMDVQTGAIKAMSNLALKDTSIYEDLNHAVVDAIEPGSTFKTATMLALLDENMVDLDDSINLQKGTLRIHNIDLHDSEPHGLEWTTIRNSFAKSSNVGMAKLAMEHFGKGDRPAFMIRKFRSFGLDMPSGIDLDGESTPTMIDPSTPGWSGTTLPWMSFGYEVALTPMQLLTFYAGIANKGRAMRPRLVSHLVKDGKISDRFQPEVLTNHMASKGAIEKITALLSEVVLSGTAEHLKTDAYNFAGKTGTSQLNYERIKKNVSIGGYRASFVGFFPVENPKYACIVVVNKPTVGSFYGGAVAGPVFRRIADRIMATKVETAAVLNHKDKPVLMPSAMPRKSAGFLADLRSIFKGYNVRAILGTKEDWVSVIPDTNRVILKELPVRANMVPNVVGMGLRDALYLLENAGCKVTISGKGKVYRQSISPGSRSRGQHIRISLQ